MMRGSLTRYVILISSVVIAASLSMPARAQIILDMSLITCKQYLEADPERQELIAAWMSGYFNASRNQKIVDFGRFETNRKNVTNYCKLKRNRSETLMSAIQKKAF